MPGDPLRAGRRVPRPREAQARRARAASRCASRSSPTASARMHGVTRTLEEIRERGVPGFEVEVIGTDPHVDRRLPAVAEVEVPFYPGLRVGVPGVPAVVDALAEGRYELLHVCAPGPAGVAGALTGRHARAAGGRLLPHRAGRLRAAALRRPARRRSGCSSRSARSTASAASSSRRPPRRTRALAELGHPGRADRALGPRRRRRALLARAARARPHAGRTASTCSTPGGSRARRASTCSPTRSSPRGRATRGCTWCSPAAGPEEERLRARLGRAATFLGWLDGDELAAAYASADLFLFCSGTDTFGQVVLEAQASGLPVVAVAAGGPAELVADGRSGLLCPPRAEALAGAVAGLAGSRAMRERLARGGLAAVRERTWEAALGRLAAGWRRALARRRRRGGVARDGAPDGAHARRERRIAVAIHDVEPATFERCALIRDWLADHGIDRATLLVIPAPDLHPFFQRRPDLAAWLLDCRDRGDAIAQHGFQHRRAGRRPRGAAAPSSRAWTPTRRARASRPAAACSRSPASSRAASSRPPTPTRPRCAASSPASFDWWATLLRLVGRERACARPGALAAPLAARRARGRARRRPAAAARPAPGRLRPPAPRARARVRAARRRAPHRRSPTTTSC